MTARTVPLDKALWRDLVLRLKIPAQCKTVAFALAYFANEDGSRVFPGQQKVADMAGLHETNARKYIRMLVGLGMLEVVKPGGGRGGATTTYRLTRPEDITTLPLWLDPKMNRVDGDPEYRVLTLGVSVDNPPVEPVDNSETPSADARCSDDPRRETPSDSYRNTERFVQKHRALALPDHTITTPRPHQDPAGSPQPGTSLALVPPLTDDTEAIAEPEPPTPPIRIPSTDEFEAGRDILAALGRATADRWRHEAERELHAAGIPLDRRAVTIRAADLATRPDRTG